LALDAAVSGNNPASRGASEVQAMTTETLSRYLFSDDAPKENPWTEDRLAFGPFAKHVADAILNLDVPNGYVIGLHGAWGSGKSTAINFVKAFIDQRNKEQLIDADKLEVIDFKPWIVSGHQDVIGVFFKVLSEALDKKAIRIAKRRKGGLKALRASADPLITAAAAVGTAFVPGLSIATKAAEELTKKSLKSGIDRWLEEPSLQSAYETLRDQLQAKNRRFLVIIDDIDRLERMEIRSIMQMVKTVGRLPNVVYLLAYDRRIVWSALDSDTPQFEGQPSFAEKVVQHELQLPQPTRSALLRILDGELQFMDETPHDLRWYRLVQAGINNWIRYPRDVFRLCNAVKFASAALEHEIDPKDLISEPVFDWIRRNRDFLLREGRFLWASQEQTAAVGEALRSRLAPERRESQIEVLCALFPTNARVISGTTVGVDSEPYFETRT
jgi:KAP family P-loop domain